jgi:Myosin N-terminal SH3-like domain
VGSHVWVEDPKLAWVDGEVSKISGSQVHVSATTGKNVSNQNSITITLCFCILHIALVNFIEELTFM